MSEGRHPASDRKRRRLRVQGDLASTADLAAAGAMVGLAVVALLGLPALMHGLAGATARILADPRPAVLAGEAGALGLVMAGGLAAALGLGAVASGLPWAASGFSLSWARLGQGLPGLLPRLAPARGLAALASAIAGLLLVALALLPAARELGARAGAGFRPHMAADFLARSLTLPAALVLPAALACAAYERRRYEARISMSDDERRRELAEDQGSPETRQARDRLASQLVGVDSPPGGDAEKGGAVALPEVG